MEDASNSGKIGDEDLEHAKQILYACRYLFEPSSHQEQLFTRAIVSLVAHYSATRPHSSRLRRAMMLAETFEKMRVFLQLATEKATTLRAVSGITENQALASTRNSR
jgi:hypothetical protein